MVKKGWRNEGEKVMSLFVCFKHWGFCNQTMYFLCLDMKTHFSTISIFSHFDIKADFCFLSAWLHSPKSEPSLFSFHLLLSPLFWLEEEIVCVTLGISWIDVVVHLSPTTLYWLLITTLKLDMCLGIASLFSFPTKYRTVAFCGRKDCQFFISLISWQGLSAHKEWQDPWSNYMPSCPGIQEQLRKRWQGSPLSLNGRHILH